MEHPTAIPTITPVETLLELVGKEKAGIVGGVGVGAVDADVSDVGDAVGMLVSDAICERSKPSVVALGAAEERDEYT